MAWVTQEYNLDKIRVAIFANEVIIGGAVGGEGFIDFRPKTKEQARGYALMLRKAAKRLEQISEDLP